MESAFAGAAALPWTTVMDAAELSLAGVYAQAALDNVPDDTAAEETAGELEALRGLAGTDPLLDFLLFRAVVSVSARAAAVGRIFAGRCGLVTEGLLTVLARRDRLVLLPAVVRRFRRLLDRREGRVDVTVTTAFEMDEAQRQQVAAEIGQKIGASPILHTAVDAELVGGMVVKVGGRVYDDSIRAELARMRTDMVEAALGRRAKNESK
jgi:F-type H+-transporting ATPase subunit delta